MLTELLYGGWWGGGAWSGVMLLCDGVIDVIQGG